ncbi:MAG TPA: class I SAM-dependent methyltransferase [Streptosporangiaceae bacterium]|jgi:SAM-dependent methyltransferase|nr:class I SAM-dependent methyltransferase [Streptosporangiaceae bacterium]
MADYWNHNVYYQPLILGAVPPGCGSALDAGCGDGLLACRLAGRCRDVTGVDRDHAMIALARERARDVRNVAFIDAEFPAFPFEDASFDFIASDTAIHHMNFEAALMAMTRLLRPGGRLAIIGLARSASAHDYARDAAGVPLNMGLGLAHAALRATHRESPSPRYPIKEPTMTWDEVRIGALRLLPGVRYRRHLLWRYSLMWRKPA